MRFYSTGRKVHTAKKCIRAWNLLDLALASLIQFAIAICEAVILKSLKNKLCTKCANARPPRCFCANVMREKSGLPEWYKERAAIVQSIKSSTICRALVLMQLQQSSTASVAPWSGAAHSQSLVACHVLYMGVPESSVQRCPNSVSCSGVLVDSL